MIAGCASPSRAVSFRLLCTGQGRVHSLRRHVSRSTQAMIWASEEAEIVNIIDYIVENVAAWGLTKVDLLP
jgi:hypothetical protein